MRGSGVRVPPIQRSNVNARSGLAAAEGLDVVFAPIICSPHEGMTGVRPGDKEPAFDGYFRFHGYMP